MSDIFTFPGRNALCCFLASALLLCAVPAADCRAAVYEVDAAGKDAAAAEGNARLNALRQCINAMISPDEARKHAMDLRPLLRKAGSLTSAEVLEKGQQGKLTALRARVTVDEDAVRAELKGIPALAGIIASSAPSSPDIDKLQESLQQLKTDAERLTQLLSSPDKDNGQQTPAKQAVGAEKGEEARGLPAGAPGKGSDEPAAQAPRSAAMPDADFLRLVADMKTPPEDIIAALAAGADPNAAVTADDHLPNANPGWPALMVYLYEKSGPRDKSAKVVKSFLDAGADADWHSTKGLQRRITQTAMYLSFRSEEGEQIFRLILSAGPDLNRVFDSGKGLLHDYLDFNGKPEIVAYMLECGADPNAVTKDSRPSRQTPVLFEAIQGIAGKKRPIAFLQAMLKAGADPNIADGTGQSALHFALECKAWEQALLLLESGANPDKTNGKGETPLFCAVEDHADMAVIKALLEHKADVNIAAAKRNNNTPLIEAARSWDEGCAELVGLLLAAGADPNARVANGRTALLFAVREKKAEVVRKLLDKGADPNIPEKDGPAPLLYAVRGGDPALVRLLAEHGADTKAKIKYKDGRMVSLRELVDLQAEAWKISEEMKACVAGLPE